MYGHDCVQFGDAGLAWEQFGNIIVHPKPMFGWDNRKVVSVHLPIFTPRSNS
jgi:hypothetical protein